MTTPNKNIEPVTNLSPGYILTLDLGTTYFKGCLFDHRGEIVSRAQRPLSKQAPFPDRCELDPEWFRRTITEIIAELGQSAGGLDDVAAVTFATQTNSFLLLDRHDQPLTPIILWPDDRARGMADDISRLLDGLALRATTGVPAMGHQFMAAKLLWLRSNSPETWSRTRRICLLSDYLTLWMSARHATEAGAAGLTGLLDVHRLAWWADACDRFEIPMAWLPECVQAGTDLGPIRAEIAAELGLPAGCRFVVGCLDQYAGAIGAGNITLGGVSETTGTVLATVRCAGCFEMDLPSDVFQGPGYQPVGKVQCWGGSCTAAPDFAAFKGWQYNCHPNIDRFNVGLPSDVFQGPSSNAGIVYQMVFGDVSGNLLEAFRNSLPDRPDFDTLVATAVEIAPGADGLRVELSDGSPMFRGLIDRHGLGHKVRAILEAVAFTLADQVDELCGEGRPAEIRSLGGAARSDLWRQLKADVLGCRVAASSCSEPTGLGAAMLAAAALGLGKPAEIVSAWVRFGPPASPNPQRHSIYRELRKS